MATDTVPDAQTIALLRTLVTALEDKKAENLKVLHVGGISDITDFLVLATGNSEPHLRALRIEAEKVLDAAKARIAGMDQGGFNSGWTVVDAYQIMAHFFTPEQRENYALEKLWKDAVELNLKAANPFAALAPAEAKKKKAPKAPAKKAAKAGASAKAKAKVPAKKAVATVPKKSPAKKPAAKSASAKKPAAKRVARKA